MLAEAMASVRPGGGTPLDAGRGRSAYGAMPHEDGLSPPVRDAGTLVVVRPRSDGAPLLLLAERAATMRFAGGATVFPGGAVDEADRAFARSLGSGLEAGDLAARIAAVRETIEECGLALTDHARALPRDRAEAVRRALRGGESFASVIAALGLGFDFERLVPFARWCPPPRGQRPRFDTRFYIAVADEAGHGELVPDGQETARLGWYSARDILTRADRGEASVIFPTRCNLERIAQFETVEALIAHARAQPVRLIAPWVEMRGGAEHLCIPEDHGYPVTAVPLAQTLRGA